MLKIGDTVKVKGKTMMGDNTMGEPIPIGTICSVVDILNIDEKEPIVGIVSEKDSYKDEPYYYFAHDLEKGHLEWVTEE